jgi:lysophospholipase L1-like esterase
LPDTTRGARSRLWSNLALVVFGLAAGVLVLEGALRIAALVVERRNAAAPGATTEARLPILALGDSNTYGLYVGKQRAYPHELEVRWNEAMPDRAIHVVNAGYPGNSSSSVRRQLGSLLATHRPAIVTVMIGGNDWWREPEPADDASVDACVRRALAPPDPAAPQPHREWRVVRMLRLLGQWLPLPVQQFLGERPPTRDGFDAAWSAELGVNLRMIVACIRHARGRPVLLTYPSHLGPYGFANRVIRSIAIAESVQLIDLARIVGERCPGSQCVYLFPPPDQHPTVEGHAWIGEILAGALANEVQPAGTR